MTVKQLAELAQEAELRDPIDWGQLAIKEEEAYMLMASHVLEQFAALDDEERLIIAMSTVTKLLVENFTLNLKLEGKA